MSKTIVQPPTSTWLTIEELELLNSLNDLEQVKLLSTVSKSILPRYLEQLYRYQTTVDHFKKLDSIYSRLPIKPHPRQRVFLALTCEEALFGGATGGGKSEALLMWLAEGVLIEGYTGAIFRRHVKDLVEGNSSILAKTYKMYPPLGGKLVGLEWQFPSGAIIYLTGLAHENSVLKVQGKELHRAAFDEITHFTEGQYSFVYNNRIRKVVNFPIKCGARVSGNPGGPGHQHTKDKYISQEAITSVKGLLELGLYHPTPFGMMFWKDKDTCYVPSRAADNPTLDIDDYFHRQLKNKNPVERARMMNGDWGVSPEGLIKPTYLRYYSTQGGPTGTDMISLLASVKDGQGGIIHTEEVIKQFHVNECRRFVTIDTAGGSKDITRESKGKPPSYFVAGVWDHKRFGGSQALLLRHIKRGREGFVTIANWLREIYATWKPSSMWVENMTMGPDLVDLLRGEMPIQCIGTEGKDKVTRAAPILNMMDEGLVYLPKYNNDWRPVIESEWLSWQGLEDETNDQIDITAYAGIIAGGFNGGVIKMDHDPRKDAKELVIGSGYNTNTSSPLGTKSRGGFWN